jgi:hypothetical protein
MIAARLRGQVPYDHCWLFTDQKVFSVNRISVMQHGPTHPSFTEAWGFLSDTKPAHTELLQASKAQLNTLAGTYKINAGCCR